MTRDLPAPFFHPFATGDLEPPAPASRVLFLGAVAGLSLPFDADVSFVQGFRPDFLALGRMDRGCTPEPTGSDYDLALVVTGKHRGENEAQLAQAIRRVKPGGTIVVGGGKMDGAASLRKRLEKELPLGGHLSKNHGIVFWLQRGPEADAFADAVTAAQAELPLVDGRFRAAPGMFSHDRIDAGSHLLAECLPTNLKGRAADFCAGWGYLSVALAQRAPGITRIDLHEADHASLEAAKVNMTALAPAMPAAFAWIDLASEKVERIYDVIVMNPPFHQGRITDPGIGHAMIRAASNALKPGGQLFMVANRGLPYEPLLKTGFAHVVELVADKTFRVWRAKR